MKTGFIGAGKVGFTLGRYMTERNKCVSGYYSLRPESAKEASLFTHSQYFESLEELVAASDIIFLTVPDGAIETVWNSIKEYSILGKLICHCSGSLSSAVFSEIDRTGAYGYSIHPLFAVHDKLQSYKEISDAYFSIEGHPKYLNMFKDMFEGFGNEVSIIDTSHKTLYHAAAVMVSNLACGLYDCACGMLMDCGFDAAGAAHALAPLFINNAHSIINVGTQAALTGPVERNDAGTVAKHLAVMNPSQAEIYTDLSKYVVEIAKRKHPNRDYSGLSQILQGMEKKTK